MFFLVGRGKVASAAYAHTDRMVIRVMNKIMGRCEASEQGNVRVSGHYAGTNAAHKRPQFHLKCSCVAVLLAFSVQTTQANPTGPSVVSGSASFNTTGNTLTVQTTPDTVINWQSFSIGANETVNFIQPSSDSTVLNRVIGNDSLAILGALTSNGNISLINPTGIQSNVGGWTTGAGFTPIDGTLTLIGSATAPGGISLLNVINSGSRVYDGTAISGGVVISGDAVVTGSTTTGSLVAYAGSTIVNTNTVANTGGTLSVANVSNYTGGIAANYAIGGTTTSGVTITAATLATTPSGTIALNGTAGELTGSTGSTVINTGNSLVTTLVNIGNIDPNIILDAINSAGGLNAINSTGGSIAIGSGVFLTRTGPNIIEATLGLGGPALPAASTISNPSAFSAWLNDNALVTHTQLDSIGTLIRSGLSSVLFGSHHRTLLDNGMTHTGSGFWATGDFARHDPNNTNASIGEFGVYKDVAPGLRLGAGAGVNQARQGLPVSGNGKLDSSYLVLEGDYQSLATGWTGSATVYLGSNRATISRGYLVGVTPNLSNGDASGSSWALRLRSDWSRITSLSGLEVSPYLAYTRAESRLDGYTETGGALPITFAAQKQTSDELRAGATLLSRLSEQTDLRFPLELAHRSNDSTVITGVIAATPFSFSNAASKQNWGRAGIELDHRLNRQTVLNGAVLFASRGGDSSWLSTVSLKYAF